MVFCISVQFQFKLSFCFSNCISANPGNVLIVLSGYSPPFPLAYTHPVLSYSHVSCHTMYPLFLWHQKFLSGCRAQIRCVYSPGCIHWYMYTWGDWSWGTFVPAPVGLAYSPVGCNGGSFATLDCTTRVLQPKACFTNLPSLLPEIPLLFLDRWI